MHVVIVNPYDALSWETHRRGRYGMLAAALVSHGHRVTWLSADFRHRAKAYRARPEGEGMVDPDVRLLAVPGYRKNVSLKRVVSHMVYGRQVARALRSMVGEDAPDVVVASIPPIESASAAMRYCRRTGCRGVIDLQDAWPRILASAFPAALRGNIARAALAPYELCARGAARRADGLVGVSPEYLTYLAGLAGNPSDVASYVFPLGYDAEHMGVSERAEGGPDDGPIHVAYIGMFGHFYDLATVVKSAALCADQGIRFTLIGDGPTWHEIDALIHDLGAQNVRLTGYVPFAEAAPILRSADVGLLPYAPDFPPNTVNKAFDYVFNGLPFVSSIRGTLADAMEAHEFGLPYVAGDEHSLARAILALNADRSRVRTMGANGYAYARDHWDGRRIYDDYVRMLEGLVQPE